MRPHRGVEEEEVPLLEGAREAGVEMAGSHSRRARLLSLNRRSLTRKVSV